MWVTGGSEWTLRSLGGVAPFKAGETRVASDSEFGDFTTLLVIRPEDSTRIELNPQPTAPLPQEGFGMNLVCPGQKIGERNFFWAWYKMKVKHAD